MATTNLTKLSVGVASKPILDVLGGSTADKTTVKDEDVRTIEILLGIPDRSIGAPLWVRGDTRHCPKCQRETNWLDIVSSALTKTHQKKLLVEVILGERKYVNVEVPNAIADLSCYNCKNPILDLRSFKCHDWAYAREALLDLIKEVSI